MGRPKPWSSPSISTRSAGASTITISTFALRAVTSKLRGETESGIFAASSIPWGAANSARSTPRPPSAAPATIQRCAREIGPCRTTAPASSDS